MPQDTFGTTHSGRVSSPAVIDVTKPQDLPPLLEDLTEVYDLDTESLQQLASSSRFHEKALTNVTLRFQDAE